MYKNNNGEDAHRKAPIFKYCGCLSYILEKYENKPKKKAPITEFFIISFIILYL
tara:strand:+ start:670 stop:831 length:162 start_codon:yes stop_codon:yes gene_type:complete